MSKYICGLLLMSVAVSGCDGRALAGNGTSRSDVARNVTRDTGPIATAITPDQQTEPHFSPAYDECIGSGDAANGVTAAMMDCIGAEIERQDAQLNQAYRMVMSRLTSAQQTALRSSERTWIKARDARCKAGGDGGGSLDGVLYANCILDATAQRVRFLETYRP
jgi:uncharacterized protein YecT (DUF1311 family)